MKYLIFIPARGGSKSVKNKNLKNLKNNPLIFYSLKTAKQISKKVPSDIFVSTDSRKILNYCKKVLKIEDYLRPKKFSTDKSNVIYSVFDCINYQKKNGKIYDAIILLQPTSPIRSTNEIIKALNIFKEDKELSMMSVCKVREHPAEIIQIKNKVKWKYLKQTNKNIYQKQQFEKNFYFIDGNLYICTINFLMKNKSFVKKNVSIPYITQKKWPIDIDYIEDFKVAESFI
jgi:CMP-N-acetylneuraminic acid synthetase